MVNCVNITTVNNVGNTKFIDIAYCLLPIPINHANVYTCVSTLGMQDCNPKARAAVLAALGGGARTAKGHRSRRGI